MKKTICIHHHPCADGFTAAWAVWRALGDKVEFVPGVYGEDPPDVTGADVIMVDFSYKRPVLEAMAKQARSILVLDHHVTAQEDLRDLLAHPVDSSPREEWERRKMGDASAAPIAGEFDMDSSGAQIAWDFFHPNKPRPVLVNYVADRDLWRFDLPRSRAIAAWMFSWEYDFGRWESCYHTLQDARLFDQAAREGHAILRKQDKDVGELVRVMRRRMVIGGHDVPVANLPYTLASDAAGMMAEGEPFAACYFDRADGQRVFSLRSREGGLNVATVAKSYGGGGHAAAAGFQVPLGWEGDDGQ